MTIHPTRTCFDDAVEILLAMVLAGQDHDQIKVVHGMILSNEPNHEGELIAHGWVECGPEVFFRGLLDGKVVDISTTRREYYKRIQIVELIRYTPAEVADHAERAGHTGPWAEPFTRYVGRKAA